MNELTNEQLKANADPNMAMRFNEGKLQWSLVHYKSLEPMIRVLEFGAKKYTKVDKFKLQFKINEICLKENFI